MADVIYRYEIDGTLVDPSGNQGPIDGSFQVDYTTGQVTNVLITGYNTGYLTRATAQDGTTEYTVNLSYIFQGPYLINYGSISYDTMFPGYADNASQTVGVKPNQFTAIVPADTCSAQEVPMVAAAISVCFSQGTLIKTNRGDIAVEDLRLGEIVVTASGEWRPIRWIGHRHLDGRTRALPHDQQPIRIRQGAFGRDTIGSDLPQRDLCLSPGHPVLVGAGADGEGGHLVPVMCLVNGTTVERMTVERVTYWHIELDQHDILLAEGLPAESYLDWGDRPFFSEAPLHALANPDFVVPGLAGRCRPVAVDGPVVEQERRRLDAVFAAALAAHCAWGNGEAGAFA